MSRFKKMLGAFLPSGFTSSVKNRVASFFVEQLLGPYLDRGVLSSKQLEVSLVDGECSMCDVKLNSQKINDLLEELKVPLELQYGLIASMRVRIPWASLADDHCSVHLSGVQLDFMLTSRTVSADEMTESMFIASLNKSISESMSISEKMAQSAYGAGSDLTETQDLPAFSDMSEEFNHVLARSVASLSDVTVNIHLQCQEGASPMALSFHLAQLDLSDEMANKVTEKSLLASKKVCFHGLTLSMNTGGSSAGKTGEPFDSGRYYGTPVDQPSIIPNSCLESLAQIRGDSHVKVSMKREEAHIGPKVEVDVFLGSLDVFLAPYQLSNLIEVVDHLTNPNQAPVRTGALPGGIGVNQPMRSRDYNLVEQQRARLNIGDRAHLTTTHELTKKLREPLDEPWALGSFPEETPSDHSLELQSYDSLDEFHSIPADKSLEEEFMSAHEFLPVKSPAYVPGYEARQKPLSAAYPSDDLGQTFAQVITQQPISALTPRALTQHSAIPHHDDHRSQATVHTGTQMRFGTLRSSSGGHDRMEEEIGVHSVRIGSFSVVLLEQNPFRGPFDNPSLSMQCSISKDYFTQLADLAPNGLANKDFITLNKIFSSCCGQDHIRFVLAPMNANVTRKTSKYHKTTDLHFTSTTASVVECWFCNSITQPLQPGLPSANPVIKQLVCFAGREEQNGSGKPSIDLNLKQREPSRAWDQPVSTSASVRLSSMYVEVDPTLVDRLATIVASVQVATATAPKDETSGNFLGVGLGMRNDPTASVQFKFYQQAMDPQGERDSTYDVRLECPMLNLGVRFPVPDLRPREERGEHWIPSMRSEVLLLYLAEFSCTTKKDMRSSSLDVVNLRFRQGKAYLQTGRDERYHFLTVEHGEPVADGSVSADGLDFPFLVIKRQEFGPRPELADFNHSTSLNSEDSSFKMDIGPQEKGSTLFAKKAVLRLLDDKSPENDSEQIEDEASKDKKHVKEQLFPASEEEMKKFEDNARIRSKLVVELTLPVCKVHLPSRGFLQLIYNRLLNDLLLWEPTPVPGQPDLNTHSSFHVSQPMFRACHTQSADSDGEDSSNDDTTYNFGANEHASPEEPDPNHLLFVLNIREGRLTAMTSAKEEELVEEELKTPVDLLVPHEVASYPNTAAMAPLWHESDEEIGDSENVGELLLDLNETTFCVLAGAKGDDNHSFFWMQSLKASLHHKGCLQRGDKPVIAVNDFESLEMSLTNSSLRPVILPSSSSAKNVFGTTDYNGSMLAVAIEINRAGEGEMKKFSVAFSLNGGTLHHHMSESNTNWLMQLVDLVDLVDEEVLGYTLPQVITTVHMHFIQCTVLYCPLHMPLRLAVCLEQLSLTSNVVTGSAATLLSFVADDVGIYLSNKHAQFEALRPSVDIRRDFVCVVTLSNLQFALHNQKEACCEPNATARANGEGELSLSQLSSDGALKARQVRNVQTWQFASSKVHIYTCADSLTAILRLMTYCAADGDFQQPPELRQGHDWLKRAPTPAVPNQRLLSPVRASANDTDTQQLMAEAMVDDHERRSRVSTNRSRVPNGRTDRNAFVSATGPAVSTNGRHISHGRYARPLDASSDSDSDEEERIVRSSTLMQSHTEVASTRPFEDEDDLTRELAEAANDEWEHVEIPECAKKAPSECSVRRLVSDDEKIVILQNHFSQPVGRTDELNAPAHFPSPLVSYNLKELSVVWHFFGGEDFCSERSEKRPKRSKETSRHGQPAVAAPNKKDVLYRDWRSVGGPGRNTNKLVEVHLSKARFKYDVYPEETSYVSRFAVTVNEFSIQDRVSTSQIHNLLYMYTSQDVPRQAFANMLTFKILRSRCSHSHGPLTDETSVHVSLLPLRLNIDQDTLYFVQEFIADIQSRNDLSSPYGSGSSTPPRERRKGSAAATRQAAAHTQDITSSLNVESRQVSADESTVATVPEAAHLATQHSLPCGSQRSNAVKQPFGSSSQSSNELPHQTYIRSFVFSPAVPIRFDYEGKCVDLEKGTLLAIIAGLGKVNCSEISLKDLVNKKGLNGWDKLFDYCYTEWRHDIYSRQLKGLLTGIGPMYSVTQFFQGFADLVWLPVEQYQRDGRILRGVQRGVSSFGTSTATATLELSSRFIQTFQGVAETMYDLVTPASGQAGRQQSQGVFVPHRNANRPGDIREGVSAALGAIQTGLGETAHNLVRVARDEHRVKGVSGAVGGVLRQLPGTVVQPLIVASEATVNILDGVHNQLKPDAHREAIEKWRGKEKN